MPPDQTSASAGMACWRLRAAQQDRAGIACRRAAGSKKFRARLFIGILQSRTVQDDIVDKFHLRKVYGDRYEEDARKDLANNSDIFEDRKSGIITIQVTDSDPQRATAIAAGIHGGTKPRGEPDEHFVRSSRTGISGGTSESVQMDLENAEKEFSQFSSKNAAIDIQAQGKAMIEGAALCKAS